MKHKIEYGWCYTDYKPGNGADSLDYRQDYVFGDKFGSVTRDILAGFNLPMPDKEEVYRGTSHDLLFINSHGLVVRIGPHDITDLMSSTILQPIGWKSTDNHIGREPFSVAIYPGIELVKDYYDLTDISVKDDISYLADEASGALLASGHNNQEVTKTNIGIVEVFNRNARKQQVPILLDMDGYFNRSDMDLSGRRHNIIKAASMHTDNQAEIMSAVVNGLAEKNSILCENYIKIFEKHQPLREMFWDAANDDGSFNKNKLNLFLDKCADIKINPQDMHFSVWSIKDGKLVRNEANKTKVELYVPWKQSDKLAM